MNTNTNSTAFTPHRIVHLDLSEGLPELPASDRHLFIVLWWRDLPLGQIEAHTRQLPMRVPDLANRIAQAITPAAGDRLFPRGFKAPLPMAVNVPPPRGEPAELNELLAATRPLEKLDQLENQSSAAAQIAEDCAPPAPRREQNNPVTPERRPSVSVIVCTRDRAEPLQRCLRSLGKLDPAPAEIIIVDNAPRTEETRQIVSASPGVRYVREPRAGLDIARNAGVHHSTGEILAFVDDDVEPHPRWIARLCDAFSAGPDVMAVTGLVLPAELETEAQYAFEINWGFNRGYRAKTFDREFFKKNRSHGVPADQIGAGANMAFRREIFNRIGYFDEQLDVGAAGCSGDSEFWYRILAAGWRCRYEPAAVVFHSHRREMENLRRQVFCYMRGHAAALLVQWERHGHWGNLRRLAFTLPRYYLKMWSGSLVRQKQNQMLWPQIAGHFSGVKFYLRNRFAR